MGSLISKLSFNDIRIWIAFLFLIRLYGITNPPLENVATWRECDVLMIARNFYETDNNIFYPRVDVAGTHTGITGSEFPGFNYAIYLTAYLFGYEHWYGRIINLLLTSFASLFFYKMIAKRFGQDAAFNATIIFMCSQAFVISRMILPDPFALSLCIISLYCALEFLDTGKLLYLIGYASLALLGCLSKISAGTVLSILAIPILNPLVPLGRKIFVGTMSLIILTCVYYWYFIWVPFLNESYQFGGHFFMGMDFLKGFGQLVQYLPKTLKQFYDAPLKYIGFCAFIFTLFITWRKKQKLALIAFILPFASYLAIIIKTGEMLTVNYHYPFMFIPSMALITGIGLQLFFSRRIVYVILCIIAVENVASQFHHFRTKDANLPLTQLESILDENNVPKNALIAINAPHVHHATPMYFAHRHGWNFPSNQLENSQLLNDLAREGCQYVLILKRVFGTDIKPPREQIFDSEDFALYKL
ncbi:MAG TPA: glycosyltransferase family 39 protein [Chryseosolibacter sp.]